MSWRQSEGMSLVETLVAMFLFSLIALSVIPAFTTQTDANTRGEVRTDAVLIAQRRFEALRALDIDPMPTGGPPEAETVEIAGRSYEVLTHYCVDDQFCPPDSPGSRHLVVEVFHRGNMIYDAATVFTDLD